MHHYQDLGSASDWSCHLGNLIQPTRNTTLIWVVTCHQYGISALVSQTSFGGETRGSSVAKCWLFSQAKAFPESTELLAFSHTVIVAGYLTVTTQLDSSDSGPYESWPIRAQQIFSRPIRIAHFTHVTYVTSQCPYLGMVWHVTPWNKEHTHTRVESTCLA